MIFKPSQYLRLKKNPLSVLSCNAGFTLAELVLAMGIMLVVLAAIISLFTSLTRSYTTQTVAAGVQQVARAGIDIMTRNIRMAGLNPLDVSPIGIVEATLESIRFRYDTNGDGTIDTNAIGDANEDMGYLLKDGKLMRQLNGATTEPLVEKVTDLTFGYLDANGDTVTSDLTAIRTVEISLTVAEPAGRDQILSRTYATRVICRNLNLQ